MALTLIRPGQLYIWKGPSLLLVDERGDCGEREQLSGYYFREARFLQSLRLEVNGQSPWLCDASVLKTDAVAFTYIYPELTQFGGGGSGQSGDEISTDAEGLPHRALSLRLVYTLSIGGLTVSVTIGNHSTRRIEADVAWALDADFADIQEAHEGKRDQHGEVHRHSSGAALTFTYQHPQLQYRTTVAPVGATAWAVSESSIKTRVQLEPQQAVVIGLQVDPSASDGAEPFADAAAREQRLDTWQEQLARITVPPNLVAERILAANIRDFASFPLLEGVPDEWLTLQAGMPLYPALFGRDTLTAGWQAAFLDCGESLDASLTRLGRMQSDRVYEWRDEEPGRIPYQVRQGPLALLDVNPYSAYYADFASPLMFVIALAHLYSWTGDRKAIERHWDVARRILDWARNLRRQRPGRISRIPDALDEGHEEPGMEGQRRCHRLRRWPASAVAARDLRVAGVLVRRPATDGLPERGDGRCTRTPRPSGEAPRISRTDSTATGGTTSRVP